MFHRIKMKFSFVFIMLHAGLGFSVYALYQLRGVIQSAKPELMPIFWFLAAGIALLYGSMLTAFWFMYSPVSPWVQRARKVMKWREWAMEELPAIIASLPALIAMVVGVLKALQSFGDQIDSAVGKNPKSAKKSKKRSTSSKNKKAA